MKRALVALALLAVACHKDEPSPPAPQTPASAAVGVGAGAGASAVPAAPGASVAMATPSSSGALPVPSPTPPRGLSTVATATATAAPPASGAVAPTASTAPPAPPAPPAKAAFSRISSPRWNIDFAAPGNCTAGADCNASLRVEALGDYHVNAEYGFRFVPGAVGGVTFGGGAPADFARQGAKVGTMSLRFQSASAGPVTVAGTFKICVCTDSVCQPETVSVSLTVPIAGG